MPQRSGAAIITAVIVVRVLIAEGLLRVVEFIFVNGKN